jgi:hypothetical protein
MTNKAILVVAIAAVLAVMLTSESTQSKTPAVVPQPTQAYKLEVPQKYDKLLIYTHGAGENIQKIQADTQKRAIFEVLKTEGYIIAYSDAHGNNWGNQASLDDYNQLYRYIASKYRFKSVTMLSQSMGGIDGLELVSERTIPVQCWAGIYPATNLAGIYDQNLIKQIAAAYANKDSEKYNPINLSNYNIPMKIYASTGDTVVPTRTNTELFSKAHPHVQWVHTTGDHGDDTNFQPADIANFYQQCLRRGE